MEKTCAFFGEDFYLAEGEKYEEPLKKLIEIMVVKNKVDLFIITGHDDFSYMAGNLAKRLKSDYSYIEIWCVMGYIPDICQKGEILSPSALYNPYEFEYEQEGLPISRRNQFIVDHSDYIISFVNSIGDSYHAVRYGLKKQKIVTNFGKWDLKTELAVPEFAEFI